MLLCLSSAREVGQAGDGRQLELTHCPWMITGAVHGPRDFWKRDGGARGLCVLRMEHMVTGSFHPNPELPVVTSRLAGGQWAVAGYELSQFCPLGIPLFGVLRPISRASIFPNIEEGSCDIRWGSSTYSCELGQVNLQTCFCICHMRLMNSTFLR